MKPLMMDVSHYDADKEVAGKMTCIPVDWTKSEQIGIAVAAIKISEGARVYRNGHWWDGAYPDPAFRMQWEAAGRRPRLAYHFFHSNRSALAQAQDVLEIWNSVQHTPDDRLCLDFETQDGMSGGACLLAAKIWMEEIAIATKMIPFLYTYPSFWLIIGGAGAAWAKNYPLWLAQWPLDIWIANLKIPPYTFAGAQLTSLLARVQDNRLIPLDGRPYNRMLAPWGGDIDVWQFTARAWTKDIPGHPAIKKVCDLSVIYKPWWTTEPTPPPVVEPRRCPTCGQPWPGG